jgi:hypothetical protein
MTRPIASNAPDAELIRLCDRIVAINAEERAIDARYPDINQDADEDPIDGPRLRANGLELQQIEARICDLTIATLAGADAAGRAAMPEGRKQLDGHLEPTNLYQLLALKLVEYHAGRAGIQDDDRHALLDIEENLRTLSAAEKLLGHIAVTELEIEGDEIAAVQGMIGDAHTAIERRWRLAHEQRRAEIEARAAVLVAHAAELAAAKAERGAPGSVDDVKKAQASWWLLRGAAKTALEFCQKAEEEHEARAAEGASLPPGAGMR